MQLITQAPYIRVIRVRGFGVQALGAAFWHSHSIASGEAHGQAKTDRTLRKP